ncbi:hypothetical protein HMSSN036_83780 [Paenibacillus macerans]|nr:hypothetical protein HMSSN036_83780 [Paenibacillus macerans]
MGQDKLTVGLIYGGKSGEHEVSLQTAFAVSQAFNYDKYELLPFYIDKQGKWSVGGKLSAPFSALEELKLESGAGDTAAAMSLLFGKLSTGESAIDVAFPLLHGTNGEDGTIQGLFEMADLPYVGAGVLASAAGMDKVIMKKLFAEAGLAQCKYCYFTASEWERASHTLVQGIEDELGYPCFVKPANLGSSVGISKARTRDELMNSIAIALRYDVKVIVEEFVDAREVEVGVLGNDEPLPSVPGESSLPVNTTITKPNIWTANRKCLSRHRWTRNWPNGSGTWPSRRSKRFRGAGFAAPIFLCGKRIRRYGSTKSTRCRVLPRSACTRCCGGRRGCPTKRCWTA